MLQFIGSTHMKAVSYIILVDKEKGKSTAILIFCLLIFIWFFGAKVEYYHVCVVDSTFAYYESYSMPE